MPGRLPLTRVAGPAFSCASRACRVAAVLIPARAAITATATPPGSAESAARTAAAGLWSAAGATGRGGRGRRGVGGAAGRVRGEGWGGVRAMMMTPFPILWRDSRFHFDCAGVFWTTIDLVRT